MLYCKKINKVQILKGTSTNKRKLSLVNIHLPKMMIHSHTINGLIFDSAFYH